MTLQFKIFKNHLQQSDHIEKKVNEFCKNRDCENIKTFVNGEIMVVSVIYSMEVLKE